MGAGVAAEAASAAKDDSSAAEGNLLAPYRKAGILLAGQAAELQPNARKPTDPDDKGVKPPNLDDWNTKEWRHSDWSLKFDTPIENGDTNEIEAMAARMIGWTAVGADRIDQTLDRTHTSAALKGHDIPKIYFKKPPWWDNRGTGLAPRVGRGGMTDRQKLILPFSVFVDALDEYVESLIYKANSSSATTSRRRSGPRCTLSEAGSSHLLLLEEVKKDTPDQRKISQHVENLEHLRFMIDATQDLANEVLTMSR